MALRRPKQQRGAGLVAADLEGRSSAEAEPLETVSAEDLVEDAAAAGERRSPRCGWPTCRCPSAAGEILVERGAVSQAALDEALLRQKEPRAPRHDPARVRAHHAGARSRPPSPPSTT
ncbi:MAG: hypothetical protein R2711_10625 [Acidimicrobiales bacterium]